MAHDDKNIVQTFTSYIQAFQTLKARSVVPCHIPCIFISPQGVVVMTNPAAVETFITHLMEVLKARGYARSELTNLHVNQLSESIAAVSVSRARFKTDGQELERLGETYTFHKSDDAWKIVVAMTHDPERILQIA
jgi:hypothetical protein